MLHEGQARCVTYFSKNTFVGKRCHRVGLLSSASAGFHAGSPPSVVELEFGGLSFEVEGKPEKKTSEQAENPATISSTHIFYRARIVPESRW